MKYSDIASQQNAAFTNTSIDGMRGQAAGWIMINAADPFTGIGYGGGGLELERPDRVYDNQSLNVKLAAAKEWLKSREKKCLMS